MVVPMRATDNKRKDLEATKWGHTVLTATWCQSGWASTAAIGYVMNTKVSSRKTRSA